MTLNSARDLELLLLASIRRKHSGLKIRQEALDVLIRHTMCAHFRNARLQRDTDEIELGC